MEFQPTIRKNRIRSSRKFRRIVNSTLKDTFFNEEEKKELVLQIIEEQFSKCFIHKYKSRTSETAFHSLRVTEANIRFIAHHCPWIIAAYLANPQFCDLLYSACRVNSVSLVKFCLKHRFDPYRTDRCFNETPFNFLVGGLRMQHWQVNNLPIFSSGIEGVRMMNEMIHRQKTMIQILQLCDPNHNVSLYRFWEEK